MFTDTIAAISTSTGGEGGIGVVRLSGKDALKIALKLFKPSLKKEIKTHTVCHGWIMNGNTPVDEVLFTYMASPKTYTGDDVVEISGHAGSSVTRTILQLIIKSGARLAQKGEFTKRAFLNGKMDLSQAEAVIDLISSKTKEASLLAASQLKGALSSKILAIKEDLMRLIAEIEAAIDFPDEIDQPVDNKLTKTINKCRLAIEEALSTADAGRLYREGAKIAIIGRPNVGKSSLMNAILRFERAIVHDEPGTTRDTIEESANIKGIPVVFIDTAGIQETQNKVEAIGIKRALASQKEADITLLVLDASVGLLKSDIELLERTNGQVRVLVLNKTDKPFKEPGGLDNEELVRTSALNGEGIVQLEGVIIKKLLGSSSLISGDVMVNTRQAQCLIKATDALNMASAAAASKIEQDLISIDIKNAISALQEITGETVSDDVISSIFERFCVGK